MISADGWFDWARREPGPRDKIYTQKNTVQRVVPHDAVGYKHGWYSRLFSTERTGRCSHGGIHLALGGDYSEYAATSQHGIMLDEIDPKTGDAVFIQHYSIFDSCWGSGSAEINCSGVCWEQERLRNNFSALWIPDHMIRANIRAIGELKDFMKWPELRAPRDAFDRTAQIYRHSECIRFGAMSTACDSKRTPRDAIIQQINEGDKEDMALTMVATVVPLPNGQTQYRLYAIGQDKPTWLTSPKAADEAIRVFGKPIPVDFAMIVELEK